MNTFSILLTSLVVSLDAMAAGFALSLKTRLTYAKTLIIGIITFFLCTAAALFGDLLEHFLGDFVTLIGGAILMTVAAHGYGALLFAHDKLHPEKPQNTLDIVLVGFAVGLDAAVANLSISLMGNHSLLVPILFALMHVVTVSFGYNAARVISKLKHVEIISPVLLFAMGLQKVLSCFL